MQRQPGQVVTPEAVVLQVPHAGPGTRIAARGLDMLIQFGLLLVLSIAIAVAGSGMRGSVALVVISLVGGFLVVFGYPAIMETTWRGRTFGKAAFGLRVVTREGAPIHFRHAAIRAALYIVDGVLLGPTIGILCLVLTTDTVRVGDMVAGTIVIRERSGAAPPTAMTFQVPYGYEDYIAALDVSGLTAEHYALVRGFLMRAPQLAPQVRYPLAVDIATPIVARLRLATPSLHPEVFLQCVAAAVQLCYAPPGWNGDPAPVPPPADPTTADSGPVVSADPDDRGFAPPS